MSVTLTNAAFAAGGPFGGEMLVGGYAALPASALPANPVYAIEVWGRFAQAAGAGTALVPLSASQFRIYVDPSNGYPVYESSVTANDVFPATSVLGGALHHFRLVVRAASVDFYVDGVLVGSDAATLPVAATDTLYLGADARDLAGTASLSAGNGLAGFAILAGDPGSGNFTPPSAAYTAATPGLVAYVPLNSGATVITGQAATVATGTSTGTSAGGSTTGSSTSTGTASTYLPTPGPLPAGTVLMSDTVVDSIGVGAHPFGTPYASNPGAFAAALKAMGVRHLRLDITDSTVSTAISTLSALVTAVPGLRLNLICKIPDGFTAAQIVQIVQGVGVAHFDAVEGQNEGDNSYEGLNQSTWASQVVTWQQQIYQAVKAAFPSLPVLSPSLLDYTIGDVAKIAGAAPYCDVVSVHGYNQAINGAPTQEFPETTLDYSAFSWYVANFVTPFKAGAPCMFTEFGYSTEQGGAWTAFQQGQYNPRGLLWGVKNGIARTYLYEFADEGTGDSDSEDNYGQVTSAFADKPSGTALANLIALLADPGASFTPTPITVSLSGAPSTVKTLVCQRQDGSYQVLLWDAVLSASTAPEAAHQVTVATSATFQSAGYAVIQNAATYTQAALSGGNTVTVPVSDSVTVLHLVPASSSGTTSGTTTSTGTGSTNTTGTSTSTGGSTSSQGSAALTQFSSGEILTAAALDGDVNAVEADAQAALTAANAAEAAANGALSQGGNAALGTLTLADELAGNQGIDVGKPEATGGTIGFVDLHSVSTPSGQVQNDYDVRLTVTGGTQGTNGQGALQVYAAGGFSVNGPVKADVSTSTALMPGGTAPVALGQLVADTLALRACGFKGDGVTDDAPHIQALLDATAPANIKITFPAGNVKLGSTITSAGSRHVSLLGDSTWFLFTFTTTTADGWQHGVAVPGTGRFEASGITWVPPSGGGGSAIHVSAHMVNDPCGAHAIIEKCRFPFYDPTGAGYWATALDLEGCWNSTMDKCQVEGNNSSIGVRLRQCAATPGPTGIVPGTNFCMSNTIVQGSGYGIRVDSQFQGVQITNANILATWGIYWPAAAGDGADLLTISSSHINALTCGLYATNVRSINITGGVYWLHGNPSAYPTWSAIHLIDCDRFNLSGNIILPSYVGSSEIPIILDATTDNINSVGFQFPCLVAGNTIMNCNAPAIQLTGHRGNVIVTGNVIESVSGIIDQSSGLLPNAIFGNVSKTSGASANAMRWDISPYGPGALSLKSLYASQGIDLGAPDASGGSSGYVDLHGVSTPAGQARNDYDVRLIAQGGVQGTNGAAALAIVAANGVNVSGQLAAGGNVTAQGGSLVAAGGQNNVAVAGGAAAGSPVSMFAYGADPNIVAEVLAKGSAAVIIGNNQPNGLSVVGAATGYGPALQASGGDPNIGLLIEGKGSGSVYLAAQQPNSLIATGGGSGQSASLSASGGANLALGATGGLATGATAGFVQIPYMAGAPTGTPATTGGATMVFDDASNKLWVYNPASSAWKGVALS